MAWASSSLPVRDVHGQAKDLLRSARGNGLAHATQTSSSDMVQRDNVSLFAGRPTPVGNYYVAPPGPRDPLGARASRPHALSGPLGKVIPRTPASPPMGQSPQFPSNVPLVGVSFGALRSSHMNHAPCGGVT